MLANRSLIHPQLHLSRARRLPTAGRVLVRPGQKVNATDVVAETYWQNPHVLVDVPRALGIPRSRFTPSMISRKVGETLKQGEEIARSRGLFRRVVRAPVEGEIVAIQGGRVVLEQRSALVSLLAGIPGQVAQIYPDRGVLIEANGALIQGVWGNRRVGFGMLAALVRNPEDELTPDRLDVSLRGSVVLAGHCRQAEALQLAEQLPLRGLILASMPASLIPAALQLSFPLILIEGFGQQPLNQAAFDLLTRHNGDDVALNAEDWNPFSGQRPEVFIPLAEVGQKSPEMASFKSGQRVRVIGLPYGGQTGALLEVLPGITRLANGVRAPAARVRLENNQAVFLPLVNLDVLE